MLVDSGTSSTRVIELVLGIRQTLMHLAICILLGPRVCVSLRQRLLGYRVVSALLLKSVQLCVCFNATVWLHWNTWAGLHQEP
jgi:hypothetical protein